MLEQAHPRYFPLFQLPFFASIPHSSQPLSAVGASPRMSICRIGASAWIPLVTTHTPTFSSRSPPSLSGTHMKTPFSAGI